MKDSPLFLSAVIKCILHEASTLEYEHWSKIMQISTSATICVLLSQLKIGMMESLQSKSISNAGNLANSTADAPQPEDCDKTRGSPARLRVNGSNLIDPATDQPITLHGVNWWSGYFQSDDGLDLETQLPLANLVRLVGILWDNGNPDTDCRTDDASKGFLSDKCVRHLDNAIKACQRHKVWVVITCRAAEAAGDGYPEDVFHDQQLADQYETMWRLENRLPRKPRTLFSVFIPLHSIIQLILDS